MLRMFFGVCFPWKFDLSHSRGTSTANISDSNRCTRLRPLQCWSAPARALIPRAQRGCMCHSQRPPVQMLTTVGQFMVTNPSIRLINTWWFLSDDDGISRIYQVSKEIGAREVCMTNLGILQDKNWALLPQDLQDRNPQSQSDSKETWFQYDLTKIRKTRQPNPGLIFLSCPQPRGLWPSPGLVALALPSHPPHPHLRSRGNHKRDCWRRIEGWSIPEWSLCPLCQLCHPPEKWWKIPFCLVIYS